MRTASKFFQAVAGFFFFVFLESLAGAFLRGDKQFGQGLIAESGVDKENQKQRRGDAHHVEETPQAFPAGALGIIKDRFSHGGMDASSYAGRGRRSTPVRTGLQLISLDAVWGAGDGGREMGWYAV